MLLAAVLTDTYHCPPFWSIITKNTPRGECPTKQSQEVQSSPPGIQFPCPLQRSKEIIRNKIQSSPHRPKFKCSFAEERKDLRLNSLSMWLVIASDLNSVSISPNICYLFQCHVSEKMLTFPCILQLLLSTKHFRYIQQACPRLSLSPGTCVE